MKSPGCFDYSQPTAETLVGVYLEASDVDAAKDKELPVEPTRDSGLPLAALFGITQTVSDCTDMPQPNAAPPR